tara:strand:- start:23147 stop:23698 length:552 start_codon:yes stop_codon:yes gene_type:complete
MNIFKLNECPTISAKEMIDKHVVKMPTESLQMISTCLHHYGFNSPYRPVMLNHPCTIWARESRDNMQWLVNHCIALCKEYTVRYGKEHKVERTVKQYDKFIVDMMNVLPNVGLTKFAQAMPDKYKNENACIAYQQYYLNEKWYFAEWKTQEPEWWPNEHIINMRLLMKQRSVETSRRVANVMQ